ncbi:MAG: CHAT domain-containing protein [Acidobacteria bacterium]|nr:CHAT domain-containing protein [Acidobacteriota bacterium]
MRTHMRHFLTFTGGLLSGVLVVCALIVAPTRAQTAQQQARPLVIGDTIERSVAGQEMHYYRAELKRGQVLRVSLQEKGADVMAVMGRAVNEQQVSAMTNYGTGFMRESLTLIPEQDEAYVLFVRAVQVADTNATYLLSTSLTDAAGQTDVQRARAEKLMEEAVRTFVVDDTESALLAVPKIEECLRVWRALGDKHWEAMSLMALGGAYLNSGDYAKAELHLLEALKLVEALRDEPSLAPVYLSLGSLHLVTGDEAQAKKYLNKSMAISRKLGDKRGANILSMAETRESFSAPTKEDRQRYEAEVAAARAKNDKRAEAAVWGQAMFRYAFGGEDMATEEKLPFMERAVREGLPLLTIVRDKDIELQLRLGLALCFYGLTASGETDEQTDALNEARSMKYLRQALVLARVQNNPTMQMVVYAHLGNHYEEDNDRLSIFFSKKAINVLQQFRQDFRLFDKETQQGFTREMEEIYGSLAFDLILESRLREAHQVVNFGRDQEFFDFQLINQPHDRLTFTPREAASEQLFEGLVESIAAKYGRNRDADFASAGEELKVAFEALEKNFGTPQSVDDVTRDVTDTLDMQAALRELSAQTGRRYAVLYFVEDITKILLITADDIKCFTGTSASEERWTHYMQAVRRQSFGELMKQQSVNAMPFMDEDRLILEFLKVLSRPEHDPRPLGARLYKTIFKAKERLPGKRSDQTLEGELAMGRIDVLLWSLRGNIRYVPMSALYDGDRREYLIEKYQNAVFTRARKERFLVESKSWTQGVGFGTSAAYPGFAPLPGVVNEVSAIFGDPTQGQKGFFSGDVFLNQNFTRQVLLTLQQSRPPLVHIASHFKFEPGDSRKSFLLLGDGDKFSLHDMQQTSTLFAGVDLLTLSACETAAQQSGANGKEVDGFAELAQRLGASSVLATLWKVNDNGTSRLMREFYRLRQENPGAPKSEILQQAQLNLLNGRHSAEVGRRIRRTRGTEIAETDDEKSRIPFTSAPEAPFEHPYYWAPFILFGGSR